MGEQINCPRCHGTGKVESRIEPIKNWVRQRWINAQKDGMTKMRLAQSLCRERQFIEDMPDGQQWVAYSYGRWRELIRQADLE